MKALIVEQQDDKLNANVQDIDEKNCLFMKLLSISITLHSIIKMD